MRITKVRIVTQDEQKEKKLDVKIVRTTGNACLQVGDQQFETADKIQNFLKQHKLENFISSFYNSSFIKNTDKRDREVKEEFEKNTKNFIRDVLQGNAVDYDEIVKSVAQLSEKIKRKQNVDLVTIWAKEKLFAKEKTPKKENNADFWKEYAARIKDLFEKKTHKLAASIHNNAVNTSNSPRGKVLTFWGNQNIDTFFHKLVKESKLDDFLTELKKEAEPLFEENGRKNAKLTSRIKDKYKDWFWGYIRSNKEVLLKWKNFENLSPEDKKIHETRQFMIEVGKYLDLYFPTKKSKKQIDRRSFDFYMNPETVKTIVRGKITNALTLFKIKAKKNNLSGDDLEFGKVRDSFLIKFLNACAFAGNNLKNIVNANTSANPTSKIKADALYRENLRNAYNVLNDSEKTEIEKALTKFFGKDLLNLIDAQKKKKKKNKDKIWKSLSVILEVLRFFRNHASHLYTQSGHLSDLSKRDASLSFSPIFDKELKDLPDILAERIKNNILYDYYSQEELEQIFTGFSLTTKPLAFIPGFARIFKMGQKKQKNTSEYLEIYQAYDDPDLEENAQAYYNALMQIYYNQFVTKFLGDKDAFYQVAKAVKAQNQKENKNREKAAFSEIEVICSEAPQNYLKELQKKLFNEETSKRKEGFLSDNETGKYQKFLDHLFIKGFNDFLLLKTPKIEFKKEKLEKENRAQNLEAIFKNLTQSYNIQDISQVGFWIFAKMLDASHLNELSNQISKYTQACQDMGKTGTQEYNDIENERKIILLCLQTNDKKYDNPQNDTTKAKNLLQGFVDDVNADWVQEKYFQGDGQTPVIFAALEQIQKYSALHIMRQVVQQAKAQITAKDFNDWQELKPKVADWMKDRQALHDKWVKNKTLGKKEKEEYKKICEDINHYEWLNNKLNFIHIKKLYHLLMDILGRFAGYAVHHERIKGGAQTSKEEETQTSKEETQTSTEEENRNYIAHFNYIGYNQLPRHSILDMIAMGRQIVQNDRKLKNAVAKSLITILDRHGVIIQFKPLHLSNEADQKACFKIASLKTKNIVHLKDRKYLSLARHDDEYIRMIEKLLCLKFI